MKQPSQNRLVCWNKPGISFLFAFISFYQLISILVLLHDFSVSPKVFSLIYCFILLLSLLHWTNWNSKLMWFWIDKFMWSIFILSKIRLQINCYEKQKMYNMTWTVTSRSLTLLTVLAWDVSWICSWDTGMLQWQLSKLYQMCHLCKCWQCGFFCILLVCQNKYAVTFLFQSPANVKLQMCILIGMCICIQTYPVIMFRWQVLEKVIENL